MIALFSEMQKELSTRVFDYVWPMKWTDIASPTPEITKINLEPVFFKWLYISARMSMGFPEASQSTIFLVPIITETGDSVTSNACAVATKTSNQNGVDY